MLPSDITNKRIEQKALRLKELFETGNIFVLLEKMRISFVPTGSQPLFKTAQAVTVYDENADKYTIICKTCSRADFYAAHELGHIVLGHFSGSLTSPQKIEANEIAANFFAACFLKNPNQDPRV